MSDTTAQDAMCAVSDLSDRLDGLADEFDEAADERAELKHQVAELGSAMPTIVATLRALAIAVDQIAKETGTNLNSAQPAPPYRPEMFVPNRAQRRQAERARRNGMGHG